MARYKNLISMILLAVLCITSLTACGEQSAEDSISKAISKSMTDIFAPESIEQFNESKEINTGTLYTKEIADRLYQSYSETLSESDKSRVAEIATTYSLSENNTSDGTVYKTDIQISYDKGSISLHYILSQNNTGIIDKMEQYTKDIPGNLRSDGYFGFSTGSIERNRVDKQIIDLLDTLDILGYTEDKPISYFIYGSMLVEASITNSTMLYAEALPDIYQDTLVATTGLGQYSNNDAKQGSITKDKKVMIGPFQISSAYYEDWVKYAPDELIEASGGKVPSDITNRGTSGQPLYLPDVLLGKVEKCLSRIDIADVYMEEHYADWADQPAEVKTFMGVMWYNIEYHGGPDGIKFAKNNPIILDYLYDICKEVYRDNDFLNDITDWSQSSKTDNECIKQICRKIDINGEKGYIAGYKEYAKEGSDTYLGDWSYAPKCLHFGLKRLESIELKALGDQIHGQK